VTNKDIIHEKSYWDEFYKNWGLDVPSQFCVQAVTDIERDVPIVEFGSGNGRDSQFMASQGYLVTAMDLSASAIQSCKDKMASRNIQHAFFMLGDVSVEADVVAALDYARTQGPNSHSTLVVYSRFLLHSLDQQQQQHYIATLGKHLIGGDRVYLEFRCTEDADKPKVFGNHYRRYVDSDALIRQMENEAHFSIDYTITGQGLARYKGEDPVVTRIIASKRSTN
jgi:tellurite methyltransferase